MRSLIVASALLVLASCQSSPEVSSGSSSSKSVNPEAPYIWKNKSFPKTLHVDPTFSPNEKGNIVSMTDEWEDSVDDKKNFFTVGSNTTDPFDLDEPDDVFGVYKATTWPAESDGALAITQIFGHRYNTGDADEYVGIVEADVLVNYGPGDNYSFDSDADDTTDSGFDLKTVVLHELGHFLGLQHIPDWYDTNRSMAKAAYKATSVMYPNIGPTEKKRSPTTLDINNLISKYKISGVGPHIVTDSMVYEPRKNDPGTKVKIIIELRKDGECIHKENGVVFRRHHIKLK